MSDELARGSQRDPWGNPERALRWAGRTGAGQRIALYEAGAWLELVYYEHDDETVRGGFALNPLYVGQLFVELAKIMAERAEEGTP